MAAPAPTVVDETEPLALDLRELRPRPSHDRVLLVEPTYFDVTYAINPYSGGDVDRDRASAQWNGLSDAYDRYAGSVAALDPDAVLDRLRSQEPPSVLEGPVPEPADRPDLVFAANLGLATAEGDGIVLASMATDERRGEPAYLASWAERAGYEVQPAPDGAFEGTGDALWHPGRRLLWGGYGVRTERAVYDELADRLDAPVLALELTDERYYHLDVCMTPLDASAVLIQPEAFADAGRDRIADVFETVLEIPVSESREGMAGNAHCVDGEHVLLPANNPETESILADAGYTPVPVDVGEFENAGGSVFCLSLELGRPA
ncbi:dimethylarginine dimethylaminohydrolase family protein [Halovivax limisalsi]|uniref:dimethylarginine dimethylaminohydrolase family protein n=1 Tax=Halovivax limisalsi TaxID=1453760 RepID=UPI001FFC7266|nr:arginine deiminase-related protein [Halovivax limisalsi]